MTKHRTRAFLYDRETTKGLIIADIFRCPPAPPYALLASPRHSVPAPDVCLADGRALRPRAAGACARASLADAHLRAAGLAGRLERVQAPRVLPLAAGARLPGPADGNLPVHLLWPGHFHAPPGHHFRNQPQGSDGIPRAKSVADGR